MRLMYRPTWLRARKLLARFLFALNKDRNSTCGSGSHFDSADIRRLAERRRSQYLVALLDRKSDEPAVDASERCRPRQFN